MAGYWNNTHARAIPIERITIEKLEFILSRARRVGECLVHQNKHHTGYAFVRINSERFSAHRVIKAIATGENPSNLVTDHLCRTTACIRPSHLEFVDNVENIRRGVSARIFIDTIAARKKAQTHCKYGHEFTEKNTYVKKVQLRNGSFIDGRSCRECHKLNERKRRRDAKENRV